MGTLNKVPALAIINSNQRISGPLKAETMRQKDFVTASRNWMTLILTAVVIAPLAGCERHAGHYNPALAGAFFPLKPSSSWTYRINSKSQKQNYVVTDKVVGMKYVPSLNVTGQVVEEFYNLDRGGSRPIVYVVKDGFLTRFSGMEYNRDNIKTPAWGQSEDGQFMPASMAPDFTWSSTIFPFGHMPDSFDIKQDHKTVFEGEEIVVPAGRYDGCMRIDTMATYEGGAFDKGPKKSKLLYRDWYAPNVGLVKTEVLEGGPQGSQMELVELVKYIGGREPIKPDND